MHTDWLKIVSTQLWYSNICLWHWLLVSQYLPCHSKIWQSDKIHVESVASANRGKVQFAAQILDFEYRVPKKETKRGSCKDILIRFYWKVGKETWSVLKLSRFSSFLISQFLLDSLTNVSLLSEQKITIGHLNMLKIVLWTAYVDETNDEVRNVVVWILWIVQQRVHFAV